jgi:hypothetical protein
MRTHLPILLAAIVCSSSASHFYAQVSPSGAPSEADKQALLDRVITNQKKDDLAQMTYERIERVEIRKSASDAQPSHIKIFRAIPAGTGIDRIRVGPDGKPTDMAAYRAELKRLERALAWAAEDGREQREAYGKVAKRQKERADLIDATRTAFLYTFIVRERLGERLLAKYRVEPNPAYKPVNRTTAVFSKVHGHVWIDEAAAQLARADLDVTEDISIATVVARIYKGSHVVHERSEVAPEIWLASYAQHDFDGRRFFIGFGIHERTFYSRYRRIGTPKEALQAIRQELSEITTASTLP